MAVQDQLSRQHADAGAVARRLDANRALADAFVRMLNEHDPDLVDEFVAVGYVNHNPFVDDGRDANRALWAGFFSALPDLEATMDDVVVADDRVAGRFTYRGTHRGELFGIPASGRRIEMHSIDIWRVSGGMFVEHWDQLNMLDMLRQIGPLALARAGVLRVFSFLRGQVRRMTTAPAGAP